MSSEIVDSQELREGSGAIKWSGTRVTFSATWNFLVVTDSATVTREEVLLSTPGLPIVGLVYGPTNMRCMSKTAKRKKDNPLYWDVVVEFESGAEQQKPNSSDPNNPDPTSWVPVFIVDSFETKQRVIYNDLATSPVPIVNYAGQLFSEPCTRSISLCSFSFTQFEDAGQDINVFLERNDTCNKSAFDGRAARTCKLNVLSAELGYYGGYAAWKATYKITYDRDTWDTEMLQVGTSFKDIADSNKIKPYMDETNMYRITGMLETTGAKRSLTATPLTTKFVTVKPIEFDFIRT